MFCVKCGKKTNNLLVNGDSMYRDVCSACNYIHYINPKIIVGVLPYKGDRVLLCKRDIEPGFGKWTLPSGFMEMGESLEEGAKREALEEANLKIRIKNSTDTLLIHGDADQVVPSTHLLEAKDFLIRNNVNVETLLIKNCDHHIPMEASSTALNYILKKN